MTDNKAQEMAGNELSLNEPTGQQSYLEDPDIAVLLSRVAAIHGRAIPAFRFGMLSETDAGVPLDSLMRYERALELWHAAFPQGQARRVLLDQIQRSEYPVLWLSQSQDRVLVIRGPLVQGGFNAETSSSEPAQVSRAELEQGFILQLRTGDESWGYGEEKPKTATDWFSYALRKHRRIFIEAIVASIAVSFLAVASAMYTMQVYDRVVPNKGYETLAVLTFGVFIAIAFELVMNTIRANMVDRASKAIDVELSSVFFSKALDIRLDSRPGTVGTFAAQVSHFESVRNFLSSTTLYLFADIPLALFFIALIGFIAGPAALVPLLIAPLAVLAGIWFRKPIEKAVQLNLEESHQKNGLLIEAVDGIESVKAAGSSWKMLNRWRSLTEKASESSLRIRLLTTYSSNMAKSIQQLSHVGIIAVGALLIVEGSLTMGGLIACVIINGRALGPIVQIPGMFVQWKNAKISLGVLDGIMAMPNDRDADSRLIVPDQCHGELRVEGAQFGYTPYLPAGSDPLDSQQPNNVPFAAPAPVIRVNKLVFRPGERVAIIGPVGSGKSTLIKLISGLFRPSEGKVMLDGIDLTQLAPEYVREHIGYLPQDVRLFQGSLRDNLTLGIPTPSDSQIMKAAAMTGLNKAIEAHPRGLELQISEGGKGLSGGQRQLVGITRLLLAQPRIVLLDEPSASVDNALEARVMQHLFTELPQTSSVIIVTHKLALLRHVHRTIFLADGHIVLDGPTDEVMSKIDSIKHRPKAEVQAELGQLKVQNG